MNEQIQELQEIIDNSTHIVFFTGAGVSTASGIPDFRSISSNNTQRNSSAFIVIKCYIQMLSPLLYTNISPL